MSEPTSFRLSEAAVNLIAKLAESLGLKRSAVIELAVRELARKHKVADKTLPKQKRARQALEAPDER